MTKKHLVDREFVKANGPLRAHEVDALDALYPELFDATVEAVSARFAGRAVPEGKTEQVRGHVSALVASDLFAKLGTQDALVDLAVDAGKGAAEKWLAGSTSVTAARASASAPPPPSALADAHDPCPARK